MPNYNAKYLRQLLKQKNWDRALFKQKMIAECIQQSAELPSDMTLDRWRTGVSEPGGNYLSIIAKVLDTKMEMFYA